MSLYEEAERLRPAKNDEALLRWNTFHREIRIMLWYGQRIRFRGGSCSNHNVASSFDDLIEGAAVDHKILDRWKSRSAEWLDPDCVPISKSSHVNLAGGSRARSVWNAVDDK